MSKPKVAFYWCASCGGCEEAVVDLAEGILPVVEAVNIVFWPVALDFKREDLEAMGDGEITASFVNGAICTSEQEEMVQLLRRKSQLLIAFGACAQLGGIPSLANLFSREEILRWVYEGSPSTDGGARPQVRWRAPEGELELPSFHGRVRSLHQVVPVDYALPGCPPPVALVSQALEALLSGKLPPRGAVLAPDVALCESCPRKESKPDKLSVSRVVRPHQVELDETTCLLAQGVVCLGPATRSGCGAACIAGNMPCTGCLGPTSRVLDQGAKALSGLASLLAAQEPQEAERLLEGLPDPAGTFYRYSVASSLLEVARGEVRHEGHGGH
jgi:F420-non-reducing hydrogenase small subunit